MSKDDYFVIVFKVLSYLYESIKQGIEPDGKTLKTIAGCNDVYWKVVFDNLVYDDYLRAEVAYCRGGDFVVLEVSITTRGVRYLERNRSMRAAKEFLGEAFISKLDSVIQSADS